MNQRRARLRAVAAALVSALFVSPLLILVLGALHPPGAPPARGWDLFAVNLDLGAFKRAFELVPLGEQLLNSLFVVAIAVPVTVLVASLAGFGITLLPRRARRIAVGLTLLGLMIPLSALWVPRFALYKQAGLLDTLWPLIAPSLMGTSPFYVLLFFWSARRIPRDFVDAARLEGLGPLRIWWRVAVPLTKATAFAVAALAFATHWSNFVEPLLYLFHPSKFTLPLGLSALSQLGPTDVPTILAGCLVATLPPVVAFSLVQGRFLDETRGAGWLGR